MSGIPFLVPKFTPVNSSGRPYASATLTFYRAGTTTPLAVYADAALTTGVGTNGVVTANSAGLFPAIYLDPTYNAKVVMKNSSGATLWTEDNIPTQAVVTAASIGAVLYPRNDGEVNAGVNPTDYTVPYGWVTRYGATGGSNDSQAFADCLASNGYAYVPSGTWRVTLDIDSKQRLYGDGIYRTILAPVTAATYVLRVNAASVAKQYVSLSDFSIQNPSLVASCTGLLFNSDDVNDINDHHHIDRVEINGFATGVKVNGRQIWTHYENLWVSGCTTGFYAATDTSTPAFNQNTWSNCMFQGCTNEGFKSTGQSVCLNFYGTTVQTNNAGNATGTAGMLLTDAEQTVLHGCYFENNGSAVAVNAGTALTNSVGLRVDGTYCYNLDISGCWMTGSGCVISIDTTTVRGGEVTKSRISALSTGFAVNVAVTTTSADSASPFVVDGSNIISGTIYFPLDASSRGSGALRQVSGTYYMTAAETVDLLYVSKLICNGTISLSTINNRLPGAMLTVENAHSTNSVTIAAALMASAADRVIVPGETATFMVNGYPNEGKFVEVSQFNTSGLLIADGVTAPSTVTGRAFIYVDTSDGDLKVKFGDGTAKLIVADT